MRRIMTPRQLSPLGPLVSAELAHTRLDLELFLGRQHLNGIILHHRQELLVGRQRKVPVRVMLIHMLNEGRKDGWVPTRHYAR